MSNYFYYILFPVILTNIVVGNQDKELNSQPQIIYSLTDSIVQKVILENNWFTSSSVVLQMNEQPQNNFLRQQILHTLFSRNNKITLYVNNADTIMACTVRELTLSYGEAFSESFFESKKVERTIFLSMDISITTVENGSVLYSKNIAKSFVDTVTYTSINLVHDQSLPYTLIVQPELSFFDSIVEPAIITIASGIAIYLFFTIRS